MKATLECAVLCLCKTPVQSDLFIGYQMDKNIMEQDQIHLPAKRVRSLSDTSDIIYSDSRCATKHRSNNGSSFVTAASEEFDADATGRTEWSWRYSPMPDRHRIPPYSVETPAHRPNTTAKESTGLSCPAFGQELEPTGPTSTFVPTYDPLASNLGGIGLPSSLPLPYPNLKKALGEFATHRRATSVSTTAEATIWDTPKRPHLRGRRKRKMLAILDANQVTDTTTTPRDVLATISSLKVAVIPEPRNHTGKIAMPTVAQKFNDSAKQVLAVKTNDTSTVKQEDGRVNRYDIWPAEALGSHYNGQITNSAADGAPAVTAITDVRVARRSDTVERGPFQEMPNPRIQHGESSTTGSMHGLSCPLSGDMISCGDTANIPIMIEDDEFVDEFTVPNTVRGTAVIPAENVDFAKDRPLDAEAPRATGANNIISVSRRVDGHVVALQDGQTLLGGHVVSNKADITMDHELVPVLGPDPNVQAPMNPRPLQATNTASASIDSNVHWTNPKNLTRPALTLHTAVPSVTGSVSRFIHFPIFFTLSNLIALICMKHDLDQDQQARITGLSLKLTDTTLLIKLDDQDCEWDWEAWIRSVGKRGGVVRVDVILAE